MSLSMFLQQFANALGLGSMYGLIAIGYTMVYGILRLINFAHGDIFMLGAYFVFFTTIEYKLPWVLGVIIAIAGATLCGLLVDRIAYRPLRDAPRISALISAIGVSFFIQNASIVAFTGIPRTVIQPKALVEPLIFGDPATGGAVRLSPLMIMVPIISFLLVGALMWMIYRTKQGLAMRSISRDIETTRLMGVSVNKTIALTFAIGSSLAAVAGIMWALRYPKVEPLMGMAPGFKAFIAAVLGGVGSVPGAMLGGLSLGFIEIMSIAFFPKLSGYKDVFAFALLVLVLQVKPTGLMGERLEDKI